MRKTISIKSVNEDILYGYAWEVEEPTATVFIVTGMEETAARYDDFANFLNENGYSVYCLDQYGQGENALDESMLGVVPRSFFSKSVRILDDLIKKYKQKGKQIIVIGHSMGSFMCQDFIQRYSRHADKVALLGTDGPETKFKYFAGYQVARLVCKFKGEEKRAKFLDKCVMGPFAKCIKDRKYDCDWISHDEAQVQKYVDDPKCGRTPTNGFYREFMKGNNRLYKSKFLAKINPELPLLIMAGEEDPVGNFGKGPKALFNLYKKIGLKNVELKLYPNMRHEVLNEIDNKTAYNDLLEFIKK